MNVKRVLTIFAVILVVFCTLNVASAGLFDFGGSDNAKTSDGKIPTVIVPSKNFDSNENTFGLCFFLEENSTTNGTKYLANQHLDVNVTDSDGNTQPYNLTTDNSGLVLINSIPKGMYNVSVKFDGNGNYSACSLNETMDLTKL